MAPATLLSLRDRLPAPSRPDAAARRPEVLRVLDLATDLFGVAVAALVLAGPEGLGVVAASGAEARRVDGALAASCRLFEALAGTETPADGRPAGVMEEIVPGRGFVAATPILSDAGRCLGAVCLLDGARRTLLTGMQRRLFAEFGALLAPALGGGAAQNPSDGAARLKAAADAEPDAFALFDADGRCLLRNARFDALVAPAEPVALPDVPDARGCEAGWIALRLARDAAPVRVTRTALAGGGWLALEERRGPYGHSLLARVEARDAFGSEGEMEHLFARCPLPMFVFDRDTRALLAANDAALGFYGWTRDALLGLDLDRLGPVDAALERWTHHARDGRALPVAGRTVDLAFLGRPAVLVTVQEGFGDAAPVDRAA